MCQLASVAGTTFDTFPYIEFPIKLNDNPSHNDGSRTLSFLCLIYLQKMVKFIYVEDAFKKKYSSRYIKIKFCLFSFTVPCYHFDSSICAPSERYHVLESGTSSNIAEKRIWISFFLTLLLLSDPSAVRFVASLCSLKAFSIFIQQ